MDAVHGMTGEIGSRAAAAATETHISTVFFTADRAYKLLKPLRTSFLDHSSTAQRLAAVDAELDLNRRLAPDVYLGTADVVEAGDIVDRMLVMRRLPAHRRLTELIRHGEEIGPCLRAIARRMAVFHATELPAPDSDAAAGRDAVRQNWEDNFADLQRSVGSAIPPAELDRARQLVARYLGGRDPLFRARIDGGFVRDGHGDLTAQDIFCLDDGPRILDCLAFDRRLRVGDVLIDVAFLAMDLHRLAGPEQAVEFLGWYGEFSNEHHPTSLAHHYIAYRANVRTKVAGLRQQQGDPTAASLVRTYHELCLKHLEQGKVTLTLIGGPPGTGKTSLAQALAAPLDAMVLGSDELRKDLAGQGHRERSFDGPGEGIYTAAMTDRTYRELLDRAERLVELGRSVVLDASWSSSANRRSAETMAAKAEADFVELECTLPTQIADERIRARLAAATDASDARPEIIDELRARHEAWPTATTVDTSVPTAEAASTVLRHHPVLRTSFSPVPP